MTSPRHLFPSRRTPLCNLEQLHPGGKANSAPSGYPFADSLGSENSQDVSDLGSCGSSEPYSDGGSSGSSGTVKISALSSLELPPENPGWEHNNEYAPYGSRVSAKLCNNASPLTPKAYTAALTHAKKHSGDRANFSQSDPFESSTSRKVRWSSRVEIHDPEYRLSSRSLPDLRFAALDTGKDTENRRKILPITTDHVPLNDRVHHIHTWDSSVSLYTSLVGFREGIVEIHHHARISITIPKQDFLGTRISICLLITNGVSSDRTIDLKRGQSYLFLDSENTQEISEHNPAEITINRDVCDAEEPLDISLRSTNAISLEGSATLIPTFRPAHGKVLLESVSIAQPVPPLFVEVIKRDNFSVWQPSRHNHDGVIRFDRLEVPSLYPAQFEDHLRIKIVELPSAEFLSLGHRGAIDVVSDFHIEVGKLLGAKIECRMSFWLEVTSAEALLTLNTHSWIPKFSFVANRLATEATGEWRKDNRGHIVLFKQPDMLPGPIRIEIAWEEPSNMAQFTGEGDHRVPLPVVLDREVLQGYVQCDKAEAISYDQPGAVGQFLPCEGRVKVRLPTLHRGYSMYLMTSQSWAVEKKTADKASQTPDTASRTVIKSSSIATSISEHAINNNSTTTSHPPIRFLLLQATIFWLVLFGVFWKVRTIHQCNETALQLDDSVSVADFSHANLESGFAESGAGRGAMYQVDEESWRDWVDVRLGWRGNGA